MAREQEGGVGAESDTVILVFPTTNRHGEKSISSDVVGNAGCLIGALDRSGQSATVVSHVAAESVQRDEIDRFSGLVAFPVSHRKMDQPTTISQRQKVRRAIPRQWFNDSAIRVVSLPAFHQPSRPIRRTVSACLMILRQHRSNRFRLRVHHPR